MGCLTEDQVLAHVLKRSGPADTQAVVAHIDRCGACFDLVAEASRGVPDGDPALLASTVPDIRLQQQGAATGGREAPQPRRRIGRYELIEQLGMGGMGIVYRAHDPALDREVALKVIRRDLPVDRLDLSGRLLREAHLMARVKHPNVVTVYDLGTDGDQIFLAMELIAGTTLRAWLGQGRRGWREILPLFLDAARGLQAAHESGLVHRDFKPDNVLVAGSRVVVTDFGLACTLTPMQGVPATNRAGTPHYMAPEQFRGEQPDVRTDIFNFSAALFEALYAQPAFLGDTYEARRDAVLSGRLRPAPPQTDVPRWLRSAAVSHLRSDVPSTNSMAMKTSSSKVPTSWTAMTLGCDSRASACASRNRRPRSTSLASLRVLSSLSATGRPSSGSNAL